MIIEELRTQLDNLQHEIFIHSLFPKQCDQLKDMRQQAVDLKKTFFNATFIETELSELENLRIEVLECDLMTQIVLSDAMNEDSKEQIRQLTALYASVS